MSFTPPKPAGWGTEEPLTSGQMNALQAAIVSADAQVNAEMVNGTTGGSYSPAIKVNIDRLAGRVRTGDEMLFDAVASLKVSNQTIRFHTSMIPKWIAPNASGINSWKLSMIGVNTAGAWQASLVDGSSLRAIVFPILLPEFAILHELGITVQGGYGISSHAATPATRPEYILRSHNGVSGAASVIYQHTDPAVMPAYDTLRTYVANSATVGPTTNLLPYTGNNTGNHYTLTIIGEGGANAVADEFALHGIYADIAVQRFEPLGRL